MAILDKIRGSTELQDLFFDLCDFELCEHEIPEWLGLAPGYRLDVFGRDGAGGVFGRKLVKLLGLPSPADPLRMLHEIVGRTPAGVFVAPEDGNEFASLFNTHRWKG